MNRSWSMLFPSVAFLLGATQSHASLHFPHVATSGPWRTEICVINLSATETVRGTLESYSDSGELVAATPLSIGPNGRKQIDVGSELAGASRTGYVVFQNLSGSPVGYTKFSLSGGDRVAIPAVDSANTDTVFVTHIAWAPWWTGVSLVNTTTAAKDLTFRFNDGKTRVLSLGAKQHRAFTISQLLDDQTYTGIESAVIENAAGVVGLELFGCGSQLGGVPLISRTATTLYFPHVAGTGGWWTGIAAYNPSTSATIQITVNPYDTDGNLLGSLTQSLKPGQRFIGLSTTLNLPPATAWLSLQSQNALVGFELFGTADQNRLAGYSVVDIEGKSGIFPKVEKNGWTGVAFVNTETQKATVTLKAHDDTGAVLATGTKFLNAHAKWVGLAEELFPGFSLGTATYFSFSSDRSVAGFQLNGSGDAMLDALPASSPSGLKTVDRTVGFLNYESTISSATQALIDILGQIGSATAGTCPQVTTEPPLTDDSDTPPNFTITASYGTGCTAPDGSTVSGRVVFAISNVTVSGTSSINLGYALTASNLTRNGTVLLNGAVSGYVTLSLGGSSVTQVSANANFSNLQVADTFISGGMSIAASNISDSGGIAGNITLIFNNLTAAGYTIYSGSLTLSAFSGVLGGQLDANLNTSQGVVDVTLTVQKPSPTRTVFNTPVPGIITGYTVTLTNVILDTGVCLSHPIGGSITVSQGGSSVSVQFDPGC